MENSDSAHQNYFSQLETIKAIEDNLVQLKSRIQYLQKEEERKTKNIEKIKNSSVPIIKNKLSQFNYMTKVRSKKQELYKQHASKIDEIKMSRFEQQNELNRSKMEIYKSKVHDSLHIREMSKKNLQIIKNARQQWLNEKKKKSQIVKMQRQQSRRKIQQFHIQKQIELKKERNQQKKQLQNRIKNIGQILAKIIKDEKSSEECFKNQQKILVKLKGVVNFMNGIKPSEFFQIIRNMNLVNNLKLNELTVQKILLEISKRKSMLEQSQNNQINIIQRSQIHKRFHSQADDNLVRIYGGNKNSFNKKLR